MSQLHSTELLYMLSHMEMDLKKCFHSSATAHKLRRGMNDPFILNELDRILGKDTSNE